MSKRIIPNNKIRICKRGLDFHQLFNLSENQNGTAKIEQIAIVSVVKKNGAYKPNTIKFRVSVSLFKALKGSK